MFFVRRSWMRPDTSWETSWAPFIRTELACETAWRFWDERRVNSSACRPLEAIARVNLIIEALASFRCQVHARLHGVPRRLGAPASDVGPGARRLLADLGGLVRHGAGRFGGLVVLLVLLGLIAGLRVELRICHRVFLKRRS